jgi:hypothetical protein
MQISIYVDLDLLNVSSRDTTVLRPDSVGEENVCNAVHETHRSRVRMSTLKQGNNFRSP